MAAVDESEIPVIELRMERILDQFVISMILALVRERGRPARTAPQNHLAQ